MEKNIKNTVLCKKYSGANPCLWRDNQFGHAMKLVLRSRRTLGICWCNSAQSEIRHVTRGNNVLLIMFRELSLNCDFRILYYLSDLFLF